VVTKEGALEATYLLKRIGVIAAAVTVLATAHIAIHLQAEEIARGLMPQYIPMTPSQLDSATRDRNVCISRSDWRAYPCTPSDDDWEQKKERTAYYDQYSWEQKNLNQGETRIQMALGILFGIGYTILLMMMLSSLRKLFSSGLAATIRKRISSLKHAAIDSGGGLREAMDRRRLHQAQKEFLSLKSLYENGVISEDAFVKRKAVLTAKLAITSR
jgi:hypothetical protein